MSDTLRNRLQDLHGQTVQTPLFNPVFQLGLELSRKLESGEMTLDDVTAQVAELECEALHSRARRLHALLAPVDEMANIAAFRRLVESSATDFDSFGARWSRPLLHAVFTGHPTFLLTEAQSEAIAATASVSGGNEGLCAASPARAPITLEGEHGQVLAALHQAAQARDRLVATILTVAAERFPDQWQQLNPLPYRLASWVGYDMDGRTDIGWTTSLSFRLLEKAEKLESYTSSARALGLPSMARRLGAAAGHSRAMAVRFAEPLDDPADLSPVANLLTADHPDKLLTLDPILAELEAEAQSAETARAIDLLTLAAAMRADGLGMGWVHFRVNAAQLHNAISRRIDPENRLDIGSGTALLRLRTLLAKVKPLRSNFAALAIENTTALRQFLAIAQIVRHIDSDAPVRMLIAECEEPQTVLAALYFAKLFGVDHKVDVSPLFETESALEHGARFLDALLGEPAYQAYARLRGRISIQTGFSDAGRFVGQIPAALAIERLHGRMARAMARHGLADVAALIFNTHGESMGRGAHPANMADRLTYPMSHWARAQFADAGVVAEMETSFQGGDGYLLFRTPQLALATLTRVAEAQTDVADQEPDPFYARTDLSLDFYRGIRRMQRDLLGWRTYARAITAFGLGLLNETGSRKSRRQSDLAADREMNLRQIRAIPHNAVLQQLGYPVNVIAGAGSAAGHETEAVAEMLSTSRRGRQLVRLLRAANNLASIKTVAAFGELFNSAYWASRPYRGMEDGLADACLALAEQLEGDDRAGEFRRLASRLRVDAVKLHRLLALVPDGAPDPDREATRRSLGALQALRLALMQHMFLRAVQIPAFSRSNDISREDILQMVFSLRVEEAVALLRRSFPVSAPSVSDFAVDEPSDWPDDAAQTYSGIQSAYIDPIANAHALCLRISTAIANHFGAHG